MLYSPRNKTTTMGDHGALNDNLTQGTKNSGYRPPDSVVSMFMHSLLLTKPYSFHDII